MKISLNKINFGDRTNSFKYGQNTILEYFDDKNKLLKRVEYDEFNRDIDSKTYDSLGEITDHQHKEYFESPTEKGFIETFKNKTQEYTRKSYTKTENGFRHNIDEYCSKTNPKTNYINEFIYNMSNKLIKIINNGKVINL